MAEERYDDPELELLYRQWEPLMMERYSKAWTIKTRRDRELRKEKHLTARDQKDYDKRSAQIRQIRAARQQRIKDFYKTIYLRKYNKQRKDIAIDIFFNHYRTLFIPEHWLVEEVHYKTFRDIKHQ